MRSAMIMAAPNGARRSKRDHPALPMTIPETIEAAQACFSAGASALHLHVRDDSGGHSLDSGRYREALAECSGAIPEMRIQITTESCGIYSVAEQLRCLEEVKPAWASLSVREVSRSPELADSIYGACEETGTELQHILYDSNDALLLTQWLGEGIVRESQTSALLVLGRYGEGDSSRIEALPPFLEALPSGFRWMACAFGPAEHDCLAEAFRLGGDCRVGFENSLEGGDGVSWPDNAASVSALRAKLSLLGVGDGVRGLSALPHCGDAE